MLLERALLAELIRNVCRRTVSNEKREMLDRLGEIYLEETETRGKLAQRIAEARAG